MGSSVATADGKIYVYHPVSSGEVWIEMKTSGTASATSTIIDLDTEFLASSVIDGGDHPLHAIATLTNGPYAYLWVEKGLTSVTVHAPIGAEFDISISAKALGKEDISYQQENDYPYDSEINITTTLSSMYILEEA